MGLDPLPKEYQLNIPLCATADTTDAEGTLIVRANRELGVMNNKLYRQCRNYDVSFTHTPVTNVTARQTLYFWTLPNTWFVRGAIKYAFNTYMQAHEDELRAGVKFARWHDFVIDEQNADDVWEYSQAELFDGDEHSHISADEAVSDTQITKNDGSTAMTFRLLGSDSNAYNIFNEYANMLKYRTSTDESVASDQPYEGLLDLKDADKMAEVGDQAPYDRDFSSFLHDGTDDQNILCLQDTIVIDPNGGIGGKSTRTFTAPLGLVWVHKYHDNALADFSQTWPTLIMRAKPGGYNGVSARSLTK